MSAPTSALLRRRLLHAPPHAAVVPPLSHPHAHQAQENAWSRRRRNNKIRPNEAVEEPDPSVYGKAPYSFREFGVRVPAGRMRSTAAATGGRGWFGGKEV